MRSQWRFHIDVGGTFTDCVARSPAGETVVRKVLNREGPDAPIQAIRSILDLSDEQPIGPVRIRLGTTRGTNALLERKGAKVALVTTEGFADLPEIGTQARPHLFRLAVERPSPLHARAVEVPERIAPDGCVIRALDEAAVRTRLRACRDDGVESVAIALLHAWADDRHESRVAEIARGIGFGHVSVATELTRTIRLLDRADTAILDAYLTPVLRRYIDQLAAAMPEADLKLMTSAGGLVDAGRFSGRDSILSGPAGGVVGFADAAQSAGFTSAIGFDMGGTSTDVSRFAGEYEYEFSGEKAGVRIQAPRYAIETVAAGGGSICRFEGGRLRVGPESAGADPGPACYGRGGPLTVTDINLRQGRIDQDRFPFSLDRDAVGDRLADIAAEAGLTPDEAADGFDAVANRKMADAIRCISTARGFDPADHLLVAFGGAAGQHACAIARLLGIGRVLAHPLAGVLSAHGIGAADVVRFTERSVLRPLADETLEDLEPLFATDAEKLRAEILTEGIPADRIEPPRRRLDLRYSGEDATIEIADPPDGDYAAAFAEAHHRLYGHVHEGRQIEIATERVEVRGLTDRTETTAESETLREPMASGYRPVRIGGRTVDAAFHRREDLRPGDRIPGPALISDPFGTVVVDGDFTAVRTGRGDLLLSRCDAAPAAAPGTSATEACDPIRLELFHNHFTHIATQMGLTLQRTALSVNVKERLDFSCALLDADGELVVNAPHIPVHLGAMGDTVRGLREHVRNIRPGDAYATNDPDLGGSHLPDITVLTPVFDPGGDELRFFLASRAHHAEIGGLRPGSAFPFAKNLAEEGVVLRNLRIMRDGRFDEAGLRAALTGGPYPSRSPDENVADIRAALAANHRGAIELAGWVDHEGWPVVRAYMRHIRDASEATTRAAIAALPDGTHRFEDGLDDGTPVHVTVQVAGDALRVNFTGTGPVQPGSLNANRSIVKAAVMYVLRCLVDRDLPLNSGVLAPVEIELPQCLLNPPACEDPTRHAAVVGGNVELSQKVVDVLLGALGLAAASQGTMNNLVFGDASFGYYETICGGCGAGPGFDGASAVHSHMTNTRLTDPEIVETRVPARIEAFSIRRGSGGVGARRGGDGVIREFSFLRPVEVSLLTQRRTTRPFGLAGGGPGAAGRNLLSKDGGRTWQDLGPLAELTVEPGWRVRIETPGGGGYGTPPHDHSEDPRP